MVEITTSKSKFGDCSSLMARNLSNQGPLETEPLSGCCAEEKYSLLETEIIGYQLKECNIKKKKAFKFDRPIILPVRHRL
jgi:hypothetical protein